MFQKSLKNFTLQLYLNANKPLNWPQIFIFKHTRNEPQMFQNKPLKETKNLQMNTSSFSLSPFHDLIILFPKNAVLFVCFFVIANHAGWLRESQEEKSVYLCVCWWRYVAGEERVGKDVLVNKRGNLMRG